LSPAIRQGVIGYVVSEERAVIGFIQKDSLGIISHNIADKNIELGCPKDHPLIRTLAYCIFSNNIGPGAIKDYPLSIIADIVKCEGIFRCIRYSYAQNSLGDIVFCDYILSR
jgi:hypothetical protein